MLFHDTVKLVRVGGGTPTVRGEMTPLVSTEPDVEGRVQVSTKYRLVVGASAVLDALDSVQWRGRTYDIQGDALLHTVAGRPHHQELIVERRVG